MFNIKWINDCKVLSLKISRGRQDGGAEGEVS